MNHKPLLGVFAATLFLSAFLIFSVQPMASKMLLPMLGGSPSVWNTAMVFFQAMLLAGYGYAHLSAHFLGYRAQATLHLCLLTAFTFILPLALPENIAPPEQTGQAMWQIGVMVTCLGGPFFVLAASAPLFQHWFSSTSHKDAENPYFLYAVSNAGSMISLLAYPTIIEPLIGLRAQTVTWHMGYLGLIALTIACALFIWNKKKVIAAEQTVPARKVEAKQKLIWVALAFIPSSLMLGVTTFITTDLASGPFLWVIPLALYLLTFIVAFSTKPFIPHKVVREITPYLIAFVILNMAISGFITMKMVMVALHLVTFFFCALLCHGELSERKPDARHLTEFYLWISFGGVLGGIFNALIAPVVFVLPLEYNIVLASVAILIWSLQKKSPRISNAFNHLGKKLGIEGVWIVDGLTIILGVGLLVASLMTGNLMFQLVGSIGVFLFLFIMVQNRMVFAICATAALIGFQPGLWSSTEKNLLITRNYFGVMRVTVKEDAHLLYHGTTVHGAQFYNENDNLSPVTYYNPKGPVADIFGATKTQAAQKVAVLGLGVGSVVCYPNAGRSFDFYEIDPDVIDIAENEQLFSYLSKCGSPYKNILGDARLKIAEAADDSYDMIFADVFSSDNIPVHVMTKEAFELYLKKLAPGGIIAMNISNRYLDLKPVLTKIAEELGMTIYFKSHAPEITDDRKTRLYTPSIFAVMSEDPIKVATFVEEYDWKPYAGDTTHVKAWTDDYANIIGSLYSLK